MQGTKSSEVGDDARTIMIRAGVGIAAVVAIGFAISPPEFLQARPSGPFPVADLEKAFVDPPAAYARFGRGPIIVEGSIASVHDERVTLDTIYFLNVQAYFKGSTAAAAPGPARLRCDALEHQDYPTGAKPLLKGCRLEP